MKPKSSIKTPPRNTSPPKRGSVVQEKLRREDSVETEKWNLLLVFLLWELIPLMWYDLGIREEVKYISDY